MKIPVLVLAVSPNAVLSRVIFSNLPGWQALPGTMFLELFEPDNMDKAQSFFLACQSTSLSQISELVVNLPGLRPTIMSFQGFGQADERIITAYMDSDTFLRLLGEHSSLDQESSDKLRQAWNSQMEGTSVKDEISYLEEMAKVNNELISTQRELSKKNVELARLNELKNRFVGMAAHDLRNPLSAISSFSRFLLDDLTEESDPTQAEFLQIIHDTGNYMLKMVEDLLDLTHMESGKLQLELEETDLSLLLRETVRLHQNLAEKRSMHILLESCPSVCKALIDPNKFKQVLSNLIGNAIKYSPEDTTVFVSAACDCKNLTITVRDQGYGIDEKEQELIFEPFKKATSATKTTAQSVGLGLSITKNIVTAHKGSIRVESKPGEGTSFIVTIPLGL